ncbi:hypothetical protein [Natrinema sp. 74]|uniref:hypothetical protein n=1 Tax=Natrinema sp. 74 TaxID=3384159 RepID=UPI0038D477C6
MAPIVEAADERADRSEGSDRFGFDPVDRRPETRRERERIDVTDLSATDIEAFVRTNVETDAVSLEHRGGRTYLLLEE